MTHTLPWEDSHQTDPLTSKSLPTSIKTLANSLRIPISISDDTGSDPLKDLPRFRLVPLASDAYGELELELMAKADKWRIPYNKTNPDFCDLENDIYDYEKLISKMRGLGIRWDFSVYDPTGLEQAIEESEDREYRSEKALDSDYYLSRGV